jgi:hypothetical protein
MNDFEKYYSGQFRQDIQMFFSRIPESSKHTFADKRIFTVQYQSLSKDLNYLSFLDPEMKGFFGTALFFTVLLDQICFTHYNDYYERFENLTRYPKFVGNSPSTDRTNFPPRDIFSAFNFSRNKETMFNNENVEFWNAFNQAKPVMKNETVAFFKTHLSDIDGHEFWEKCELPYHP